MDLKQIGWTAAIPWAAAAITLYSVGRLSDWLLVKTGTLRVARTYPMAVLHGLVALAVLPLAFVDNFPIALICISIAVSAGLGANPIFYAVIADIVPQRAGTCMGVMNSGFALAGFLAPVITGFALDATGTFAVAFGLIAFFAASSVIGLLVWHHPDASAKATNLSKAGTS